MLETMIDMVPKVPTKEEGKSNAASKKQKEPEILSESTSTKKESEPARLVAVRKNLTEATKVPTEDELVQESKELLIRQRTETWKTLAQDFDPHITTIGVAGEFRAIRYDELYEQYYAEGIAGHMDELVAQRFTLQVGLIAVAIVAKLSEPRKDSSHERSGIFHEMMEDMKQDLKLHIDVLTAAIHAVKGDFSKINGLTAREQVSLDNRQERESTQITELEQSITQLGGSDLLADYESNYLTSSDELQKLQKGTDKDTVIAAMLLRRNNLAHKKQSTNQRRAWLDHLDDPRTYTAQPRERGLRAVVEEFKAIWVKQPVVCSNPVKI